MNDVHELSVDELSSSTEETSKSLEISITKIATTIKLAMGIVTIGDIFPNLAGTIKLVCHSCDNQNSFSKLKLSKDKKTLVGVMFIGKSQFIENDCFLVKSKLYKSVLKYKIFSIQIENESQRELITGEFNKWFNQFASSINIQFKLFNKERKQQEQLSCCFPVRQKKMMCIANSPRMPDALELSMMSKSKYSNYVDHTSSSDYSGDVAEYAHATQLSMSKSESLNSLVLIPEKDYVIKFGSCAPQIIPSHAISDKYISPISDNEPISPLSCDSVHVATYYSPPPPPSSLSQEMNDALYYHPNQILRKQISKSRLYVQSPLPIENSLIESELVENKSNTLNKFDMCKNLIKDNGKKSKQDKQQMDKLIKELDFTNCKSYMLRMHRPLPTTPLMSPPSSPSSPSSPLPHTPLMSSPLPPTPIVVSKNNIMSVITDV